MKYRLVLIMIVVSVLSFSIVSFGNSQEVIFKADHTGPSTKTEGRAMEWMSDYIAEKSDGRIKMDTFHLGALCGRDANTGFEMTMSGTIEMFIESNILLTAWDPRYQVNLLPFMFKGMDETYALAKSQFAKEEMGSWLKDKGLIILGWWTRPFRQLTNNRNSVRKPEDLKGMKIRVSGGGIILDTLKAFGADPSPMAMGEVYMALQLKTIHAQENGLTSIMSNKMYEVCDYLTYWDYIGDLLAVAVNKSWWESLTDEDRNIIQEAVDKAQDYVYYVDVDTEPLLLEELKADMQVDILTNEELDVFKEAAQPVWEQYAAIVGEDNIKAIEEVLGQ